MDWRVVLLIVIWFATAGMLAWVMFGEPPVASPTTFCPCPTKKESSRDEALHEYILDRMREAMKHL